MLNEHYWFCQPHAAEYNRNWNFFAGMSEGEVRRRQQEELFTGGRPTWEMKAGRMSREAAAFSNKFTQGRGLPRPVQPVRQERRAARPPSPKSGAMGKIERNALADLDLDSQRRRARRSAPATPSWCAACTPTPTAATGPASTACSG